VRSAITLCVAVLFLCCPRAQAGPPFLTDDPVPVDFRHWEFYLASQWEASHGAATGTAPHIEVNYGAFPEMQLHMIVPAAVAWMAGMETSYGLGDIEVGVKYRFVEESDWCPQVGAFPLLELPTGSEKRGLGTGELQALLPIWIQKSVGSWTTYGGGGVQLAGGGESPVLGWLVQRQLLSMLALGSEVYYTGASAGVPAETKVNVGLILDLSDQYHLLLSAGPSFGGDSLLQAYGAYLVTF
jgi:hypothetical protein